MQYHNKSFQAGSVPTTSIWYTGATGSGKTTRLIEQLRHWTGVQTAGVQSPESGFSLVSQAPPCLIFAASSSNRLSLLDRIAPAATPASSTLFECFTPVGFFQNEVMQFWPLLMAQLELKTEAPMRLHPETEQELAARLWQPQLESGQLRQTGVPDAMMVQRTLELLRLAAASGTPHEQIPLLLEEGLTEQAGSPQLWRQMGDAVNRWWRWCLERGILTYAILSELYWRYLLPNPRYQQQLKQRYRAVLADDVDEYPAAARALFEFFLDQDIPAAFSFNPQGGIRLGLGADPDYWAGLAERCRVELLQPPADNLAVGWGQVVVEAIRNPLSMPQLPDSVRLIQTVSKAQLLRQTAEIIATAVQSQEVQPQEIAIIAPGLDAITRYTLEEILSSKGIPLVLLNLQQPLVRSPLVRSLLTLLALIYPNLGRLVDREAVAEMLVILSQSQPRAAVAASAPDAPSFSITPQGVAGKPRIDPVRAGLLADHCFVPDPLTPQLLPATSFPRWDRLGYQAAEAYGEFLQWLTVQQQQATISPAVMIERAIQRFFSGELTYDQQTLLRELMEAAQHYWEVESRLGQFNRTPVSAATTAGRFIQLLRAGTITGNPPAEARDPAKPAVTLATIYQYRSERLYHRWQFWLDAGSPFWLTGRVSLFAAPLFLRQRLNRIWTAADEFTANQNYLEREIVDLLGRATDSSDQRSVRVYLCHCDLAVNGQEQSGALMPIVNAAVPVN
ncbi:MAG: recombinase family protein [Elainella sp. C42_A2020_010]|nr:recombinase family protein [Elainella sp. C42_A2020_010]